MSGCPPCSLYGYGCGDCTYVLHVCVCRDDALPQLRRLTDRLPTLPLPHLPDTGLRQRPRQPLLTTEDLRSAHTYTRITCIILILPPGCMIDRERLHHRYTSSSVSCRALSSCWLCIGHPRHTVPLKLETPSTHATHTTHKNISRDTFLSFEVGDRHCGAHTTSRLRGELAP